VLSPHEVELTATDGTKTVYTAKTILLAPGGRAWYPKIPGADLVGRCRLTLSNPC